MLINQIVPLDIKDRLCIHAKDGPTYLIAESRQGKTTETIRQAVFRQDTILSTEADFYKACGIKHANNKINDLEVTYIGLKDVFDPDFHIGRRELHLCVDNAKQILEELLSDRFDAKVVIDFMALEA